MKPNLDEKARRMLTTAALYCTEPRIAILKVLLEARRPVRQDQIAECLGDRALNKVTIYRTLASLVKTGLVHRAFMQKRASYFELAHNCTETQCHPHFTCSNCGTTHCLTGFAVPMAPSRYRGFVIHHQQVRLEGLCPACA
ncbi:MAG: transcriptional repressor [Sedimentisphaerales bacterium]|nr:transcriptional repressor [Sedimentisphaerales bacterium]